MSTDGNDSIRFDRVAVLGPIEAALRFTRTAHEVGDERGRPLHVVALHDDPSRTDAIVRAADAVVAIAGSGPDALARALAAADGDDEAALLATIERAAAEAQASFGDPRLYLEALLAGARHLEVTVVAAR